MSQLDYSNLPPAFAGAAIACAIISSSAIYFGSMGTAGAMAVAAAGFGLLAWRLR